MAQARTAKARCTWLIADYGNEPIGYCNEPTDLRGGRRLPFCPEHQAIHDAEEDQLCGGYEPT